MKTVEKGWRRLTTVENNGKQLILAKDSEKWWKTMKNKEIAMKNGEQMCKTFLFARWKPVTKY